MHFSHIGFIFVVMRKNNKTKKSALVRERRLQVWQSYACLVVDGATGKGDDEYLKKGSKVFCGCCGALVGKMSTDYQFPISYNGLKSRLNENRLKGKDFVRCDSCKQTLFSDCTKMVLTRLDNFIAIQNKEIANAVVAQFKDQPEKLEAIQKELERTGKPETEETKIVSINSRRKKRK